MRYLERCPDEEVAHARIELERLISQYPDDNGTLAKRLRSEPPEGINNDFYAALTQLLIYDRLTHHSCQVTADEQLTGNAKRYDFAVRAKSERSCAIECATIATQPGWQEWDSSMAVLVDLVNDTLSSSQFLITLWVHGDQPNAEERSLILDRIESALAEAETDLADNISVEGRRLEFSVPSGAEIHVGFHQTDGTEGRDRIVGSWNLAGGLTKGELRLRGRLNNKYPAQYQVDTPFVVALGLAAHDIGDSTVKAALYGMEQVRIRLDDESSSEWTGRDTSGFFCATPAKAGNARVAGVLVIPNVWNALFASGWELDYYENPHSADSIDPRDLGVDRIFGVISRDATGATLDWLE